MNPPEFRFRIELLNPAVHRRESFNCESAELAEFLRTRARREMEARASACFVLVDSADPSRILGYYTLSQTSIDISLLPEAVARKLPRYRELGASLIGRLARDSAWRAKGIGGILLVDALRRSARLSSEMGAVVVVTDPKDEKARSFYKSFGFLALDERRMFIPMRTILKTHQLD